MTFPSSSPSASELTTQDFEWSRTRDFEWSRTNDFEWSRTDDFEWSRAPHDPEPVESPGPAAEVWMLPVLDGGEHGAPAHGAALSGLDAWLL